MVFYRALQRTLIALCLASKSFYFIKLFDDGRDRGHLLWYTSAKIVQRTDAHALPTLYPSYHLSHALLLSLVLTASPTRKQNVCNHMTFSFVGVREPLSKYGDFGCLFTQHMGQKFANLND